MTTYNHVSKPKQIPDFYIFIRSTEGRNIRVGAAFRHRTGEGLTLLIGDTRYMAFAPRTDTAPVAELEG